MSPVPTGAAARLSIEVQGAVQGVGYRPFVYRLARQLGLRGFVCNGPAGVTIEVEGAPAVLEELAQRLEREAPPHASVRTVARRWVEPLGDDAFEIRASEGGGDKRVLVLPDLATCDACLGDIRTPCNRRYRYAFTNCTHCGPRFSILESLPYDRSRTTMRGFTQCAACQAEYGDPGDRRFHAQPNACPACGPQLALWDAAGRPTVGGPEVIEAAARALGEGAIVALKGLGGFQLLVRADDGAAVARLRVRKHREEKPFALMAPSLAAVHAACSCSREEESLLRSAAAPIVLLRRGSAAAIAPEVAPGNPHLGVMLPTTPLHHLLLAEVAAPLVATSGNLSDEPICTDEREAVARLGALADLFVVHDRPIARPLDDSVARVVAGRVVLLRRARGYAPWPVTLSGAPAKPVLALGAHQKSTVAVTVGAEAFGSQHVGDLETPLARQVYAAATRDLSRLYAVTPALVACDLHPDYHSTRFAEGLGLPLVRVQHHHAHVRACMLDNDLEGPVLGVSWDGTGLGHDGTIWGGELLIVDDAATEPCRRVGHLGTFALPGGEAAARQPWRSALGVLFHLDGAAALATPAWRALGVLSAAEERALVGALERGTQPRTSSAGRLFDALSCLLGLGAHATFEGQAAMRLEFAAATGEVTAYPMELLPVEDGRIVLDWAPLVRATLADRAGGQSVGACAARIHAGLAVGIACAAERIGVERVLLTGGCFQNARLLEATVAALRARGLDPYHHSRIPPNDGGIALGQLAAVVAAERARASRR